MNAHPLEPLMPDQPDVRVTITRYTVSPLPAVVVGRRWFELDVELTRAGWIVHDGHSGYDAVGVKHPGRLEASPFEDYEEALDTARRVAAHHTA